jgi:hypothetical protein
VADDGTSRRDEFTKFLSKLIDLFKKLPLKKVTGHQTFDLLFDLLMIGAMWAALKQGNLSRDQKFSLVIICLALMGASFWFNRPIRRPLRR